MHGKHLVIFSGFGILAVAFAVLYKRKKWSLQKTKKKEMTLYWFDNFRSRRCEWLIAELGVQSDVELVCLNPQDPNQEKLANYRKVHPHGTIPAMKLDDETVIIESGAICLYLADLYGRLVPDLSQKHNYYNFVLYACSTLDEILENLYHQWIDTLLEDQDTELIDKNVRKFQTFGRYFTKVLTGKQYICGNRFTAADCVLGYNIWWASTMRSGVLLNEFPILLDYYDRLQCRSAFQRTFTEELK
ncbi:hypothetical protein ACJMK2_033656 [Sinanodonta woodiana]|uniref:Glutathione S-transferase n=1 Tax=Sinanodonta woodiana TaxID=1069815 RepID=A0ABD3WP17_SINWO